MGKSFFMRQRWLLLVNLIGIRSALTTASPCQLAWQMSCIVRALAGSTTSAIAGSPRVLTGKCLIQNGQILKKFIPHLRYGCAPLYWHPFVQGSGIHLGPFLLIASYLGPRLTRFVVVPPHDRLNCETPDIDFDNTRGMSLEGTK